MTVWTDSIEMRPGGWLTIWQVERNGAMIVAYSDVANLRTATNLMYGFIGLLALYVTGRFSIAEWRQLAPDVIRANHARRARTPTTA